MGVKLVVVFLCAAVGVASGYMLMRSYKRNTRYLEDMCSVITELKRNISYKRDGAVSILRGVSVKSAIVKKQIEEYIFYASAKDGKLELSRAYLPKDVYDDAVKLFFAVGASDGNGQVEALTAFSESFEKKRERAATRCEKYGPLAVKLGLLLGLGVGIMFI